MREKLAPLMQQIGEEYFSFAESMKDHTTFKIGGPVKCMIFPKTKDMIVSTIKYLIDNNIRFMIIGKGSNLLVDDKGYNGVIVKLAENFSYAKVEGQIVYAEAGISMNDLAYFLASHSLKGFEPLSGIPGTIGGAVSMNAGAYDCEIRQFVDSVEAVDRQGNIYNFTCNQMNFGYRQSLVQDKKLIVLSCRLRFEKGDKSEIIAAIEDYTQRRAFRQPLEYGSAGSMFKRPKGYFAGKLIDDSNLRGFRVNDAQVAEKHAGFVINRGNASYQDVIDLVTHVKATVKEKFGVQLEEEVRIIRYDATSEVKYEGENK